MPKHRYKVTLTPQEHSDLTELTTKGKHSSQKVLNALILRGCDKGPGHERKLTGAQLAEVLPVSMRKIDRLKQRFDKEGLEAALGKHKPNRAYERKVDGDFEAKLVALRCSKSSPGHSRWTLLLLADRMVELEYVDSISHETVRRVLKKRNEAAAPRTMGYPTQTKRSLRNTDRTGAR